MSDAIRAAILSGSIAGIVAFLGSMIVALINRRTTLTSTRASNEKAIEIANLSNKTTLAATRESNATTLSTLEISRMHEREREARRRRLDQLEEMGLKFVECSENWYECVSQSIYTTFPKPEYARGALAHAHDRIRELNKLDVFNEMRKLRARARVILRPDLAEEFEQFSGFYFATTAAIRAGNEADAFQKQALLMAHGDKTIESLAREQQGT